jgi:carbon storage regulator
MIGENVEIVIVNVHGNKVRLGINAPKNISVHRKEVYEAIKLEKDMGVRLKFL